MSSCSIRGGQLPTLRTTAIEYVWLFMTKKLFSYLWVSSTFTSVPTPLGLYLYCRYKSDSADVMWSVKTLQQVSVHLPYKSRFGVFTTLLIWILYHLKKCYQFVSRRLSIKEPNWLLILNRGCSFPNPQIPMENKEGKYIQGNYTQQQSFIKVSKEYTNWYELIGFAGWYDKYNGKLWGR